MSELLKIMNFTVLEIKTRMKEVESDESYSKPEKSNLTTLFIGKLNGVLAVANYALTREEYQEFLDLNFPIIE